MDGGGHRRQGEEHAGCQIGAGVTPPATRTGAKALDGALRVELKVFKRQRQPSASRCVAATYVYVLMAGKRNAQTAYFRQVAPPWRAMVAEGRP
jgi:hypothetical protein